MSRTHVVIGVVILAVGAACLLRPSTGRSAGALEEMKRPYHGPLVRGPRDLAKALAEARRAGIPTTPAGIQAPAPKNNAAPFYEELSREYTTGTPPDTWDATERFMADPVHASKADADVISRLLRSNARRLRLIHRAAAAPACVFHRKWSDGAWILLPEYAAMRSAERWLSRESGMMLRECRFLQAVHNQALGFRVAQHAASDPIFMGYLVAEACDSISLTGMRRILRASGGRRDVAEAVRRALLAHPDKLNPARSLEGELVLARATMQKVRHTKDLFRTLAEVGGMEHIGDDGPAASPDAGSPSGQLQDRGTLQPHFFEYWEDEGESVLIRDYTALIRAARLPSSRRQAAIQRIIDEMRARAKSETSGVVMVDHPDVFFETLFGLADQYQPTDRERYETAARRVLIAATWALAYHAKSGKFPESLAQAGAPAITDPYTGAPISYRRNASGFEIHSHGPAASEMKPSMSRDLRFQWPASVPSPH